MTGKKCVQVLEDGTQCDAWALHGKDKCFSHDGSSAGEKALAVSKGGATRRAVVEEPLKQITVSTPQDVVRLLAETINEVRDGSLDVRIATAIGYLGGQLLRAFEVAELDNKAEAVKELIGYKVSATPRKSNYA